MAEDDETTGQRNYKTTFSELLLFRKPDHVSCLNAIRREPALFHFQRVKDGLGWSVRIQGQRLHLRYLHNLVFLIHEGNGQGDGGIFHPEGVIAFRLEDEEHAFILSQGGSTH